ncbi:hypothetical protein R4902_001961 [Salmonella enterica]|nr:hypothetical protein [Salmonella enterica]EKC0210821.1 hypothetical protein [Salmonella enterica]EKI3972046.1 hypothetical protein [Salmonella enterica]EKS4178311.1 hypothetical protein [Salmonella enterica]ELD7705224.1 hypothetical protein [Salmonella enterica]
MNFDEISFINNLFKQTIENRIGWSLATNIPRVLYAQSEFLITSCYESTILQNNQRLYLFRYRVPEYYGEHDTFYNIEKVRLALISHDQISWQSYSDSSPIYNLFDYVSLMFSGINDIFG